MKYSRGLNLAAMARLMAKPVGRGIKRKAVSQSGKKRKTGVSTRTRVKLALPRKRPTKYFTMGRGPTRFRRGRRGTQISTCRKYGSDVVFERRGVISDAQRVDIGHAEIPALECFQSVVRSIYRAVYERSGNIITNWLDKPAVGTVGSVAQTQEILFQYRVKRADNFAIDVRFYRVVGTDVSHKDIAAQLAGDILDYITTSYTSVVFESIRIYTDTTSGFVRWSGQVNLLTSKLNLKVMSCLVIQNRTKGAAATDDLADDVTNNPVYGRQFTCRGNGLKFRVSNNNFSTNTESIVADDYGLILGGNTTQGNLRKIASPTMFQNTIGTGKVNVQPGQVKKSTLYLDRQMSLQYFFQLFKMWITESTSSSSNKQIHIPLGKLRYFQFEKLCDTGEGGQSISVGYELNQTICSYIKYSNHQGTSRLTYSS